MWNGAPNLPQRRAQQTTNPPISGAHSARKIRDPTAKIRDLAKRWLAWTDSDEDFLTEFAGRLKAPVELINPDAAKLLGTEGGRFETIKIVFETLQDEHKRVLVITPFPVPSANLFVTERGHAKILDFGLAKLASADERGMPAGETKALVTTPGMAVGTIAYMSPEQARGEPVDARTDLFSFGAVLYEMLAQKRAFEGTSHLSVASTILEKEPDPISTIRPTTPPGLDHAIRRCLAKDPEERWQTARDLALELKWIAEAPSEQGVPAGVSIEKKNRRRLSWLVAAVLAITSVAGFAFYMQRATADAPLIVADIAPPDGAEFDLFNLFNSEGLALSPDGRTLAFCAHRGTSPRMLWVRALNSSFAQSLPGTEEASTPFWSPDGRRIGFAADLKLKTIDVSAQTCWSLPICRPQGGAATAKELSSSPD